jgi:DNA-binding NarL/FixJ family response regulator
MKSAKEATEPDTLSESGKRLKASGHRIRAAAPLASRPQILLVEDNDGVGKTLKKTLEKWVDVTWARNFDEALAAFSTEVFAALITDVRLPGRSGFEVLEEFRKVQASPAMVLTGHFDEEGSRRACELGAQYVAKPITLSALRAFVTQPASFEKAMVDTLDKWRVRYGLSEAEGNILHQAACGHSSNAISEARGTAGSTLVAQLGSARRKTRDDSSGEMIGRLLREVAGQPAACAELPVRRRSDVFAVAAQRASAPPLSERERDVVMRRRLGSSNKEIAYDLGIAHATVRTLSRRANAKLGIADSQVPLKVASKKLDRD